MVTADPPTRLPTPEEARAEIERRALAAARVDTVAFCGLYEPKVALPGSGLVPYVPYGEQVALLRTLDAGNSALAHKSRQTGVSTTVMIQRLRACLQPNLTHLIVSAKRELAAELIDIARTAALNCTVPFPLKIVTDNANELEFENGSRITGEASGKESGRTYAATSVMLDEVRSLPYPDEMWQSLAPTTTHGGSVCMVSTPDIEGSFFHGHWIAVSEQQTDWGYHEFRWQDWPGRGPDWAEKTRREMRLTQQQWDQEYELQWGSVGDAVFSKEAVDLAVRLGKEPYEPPELWARGYSAMGCDYAGGGRAETVLLVLDTRKRPVRVIEVEHDETWSNPVQVARTSKLAKRYNVAPRCDATGVGWGVVSALDCRHVPVTMTNGAKVTGTRQEPHIPRDQLYAHLAYDCEQGQVAVPEKYQELILAMRSLTWAKTGQYLDHVDALALAYWGATGGPRRRRIGWASSDAPREGTTQDLRPEAFTPAGPLGQR